MYLKPSVEGILISPFINIVQSLLRIPLSNGQPLFILATSCFIAVKKPEIEIEESD